VYLTKKIGLVAIAFTLSAIACSCGSGPRSSPPKAVPSKGPGTGVANGGSTQLSGSGCSVTLPGKWKREAAAEGSADSWDAENSDKSATLSVLAMQWKPQTPAKEWRPDLEAVLNLRRDAERNESASVTFSPIEYIDDAKYPAALFTSLQPNSNERMATMVRASTKQLCVLFLIFDEPDQNVFSNHAKAVLQSVVVGS